LCGVNTEFAVFWEERGLYNEIIFIIALGKGNKKSPTEAGLKVLQPTAYSLIVVRK